MLLIKKWTDSCKTIKVTKKLIKRKKCYHINRRTLPKKFQSLI